MNGSGQLSRIYSVVVDVVDVVYSVYYVVVVDALGADYVVDAFDVFKMMTFQNIDNELPIRKMKNITTGFEIN